MRPLLAATMAIGVALSPARPVVGRANSASVASVESSRTRPGAGLPTVRVRHYTMSGDIRPLLFWIGQDDIGLARVTWRVGGSGVRGYELLIGTDPAKAPRALNRWGLVAEEVEAGGGSLLALMTGSPDTSLDEATTADGRGGVDLRSVRHELRRGSAIWRLARVRTADRLTVHDVDRALDSVEHDSARHLGGETAQPPHTRSGFLVALADLVERGAGGGVDSTQLDHLTRERVRFVFGRESYELRLKSSRGHAIDLDARPERVVRSTFEIRTLSSGDRTRFDVSFGTTGALTGVPLAAEWQPRWWLKVRLRLQQDRARSGHVGS